MALRAGSRQALPPERRVLLRALAITVVRRLVDPTPKAEDAFITKAHKTRAA